MYKTFYYTVYLLFVLVLFSCEKGQVKATENIRVAFMSDVHLQDIYAVFSDTDYKGVMNPVTGKYNTIRTMEAQLHSTRLFNENYFAFMAALDDAVQKGIKIIALPGDFSDDGQPMNVRALNKILKEYTQKHDITFLITTGNHDPVRPFEGGAGKKDFLGEGGRQQAIFSREGSSLNGELEPVITQDIKTWGYDGIINELSDFGFFPQKKFLYWETPFSNYGYENYTLENALKASALSTRQYNISEKLKLPDVSYLVEPQEGLWLLAIDANVYVPKQDNDSVSKKPENYNGASIGYNNVLSHKRHLIQWVAEVAKEAEKRGKTLIAFSHYPMVEFNDGTSEMKKAVFGSNKMQLHRVPKQEVAESFANAGLKVHFGGHMHINDTGIHKTEKGNTLINIQTPSLAAYPSAYKILTLQSNKVLEVETIPLTSVPRFQELFPLYEEEHDYLIEQNKNLIWSRDILKAETYQEYVTWHLKELVRLRFMPNDWPDILNEQFVDVTGRDLLVQAIKDGDSLRVSEKLLASKLTFEDFDAWNGHDLVFDYYRLHNGDHLALNDIGAIRIGQYKILLDQLSQMETLKSKNLLRNFAEIFQKQFKGAPSSHFQIDLETGQVKALEGNL
jgi:hypothetical protein